MPGIPHTGMVDQGKGWKQASTPESCHVAAVTFEYSQSSVNILFCIVSGLASFYQKIYTFFLYLKIFSISVKKIALKEF